jgi:hypothetical protein
MLTQQLPKVQQTCSQVSTLWYFGPVCAGCSRQLLLLVLSPRYGSKGSTQRSDGLIVAVGDAADLFLPSA